MFFSKSIDEKIDVWAKKGYIGKLFKTARTHEDQRVRARAYAAMGLIRNELRLPLVPCQQATYDLMVDTIKPLGLI